MQVLRQVTDNVEVTVSLFYIGTKENDMDNIEHNVRLSVIISIISYLVELCYSYTEFNWTNNCVTILSNCTHKYQCTDGHKSISKEFWNWITTIATGISIFTSICYRRFMQCTNTVCVFIIWQCDWYNFRGNLIIEQQNASDTTVHIPIVNIDKHDIYAVTLSSGGQHHHPSSSTADDYSV